MKPIPLPALDVRRVARYASSRTALAATSLCVALSAAWAGGHADHDRARAAVEAGEIQPLPVLLDQLQRSHPGQVLALALERDDGRWIYEVKLLQADGRLVKLEVDARSGQVIKVRRKAQGEAHR